MKSFLLKSPLVMGLLIITLGLNAQHNDCSNAQFVNPTFNCQIPQSFYTNQQYMFAQAPEWGGDFGLSNYPVYAGSAAQRDQWLKFTAPATSLNIEIRPNQQNTPYVDAMGVEVYAGTCDNLQLLVSNPYSTGIASETDLNLTDLTIGQVYYIRVLDYLTLFYDPNNFENFTRNFYVNLCYDCIGLSSAIATINNVPTTNCEGSVPLIVTTQSGVTIQWFNQGVLIPNAIDNTYIASESGAYSCVVSSPSCTNTSNVINVFSSAAASISNSGQPAICNGQSILLQANQGNGYSYQWSKDGIDLTTANSSSLVVMDPGTYAVEITNGSCVTSAQTIITAGEIPIAPLITPQGSLVLCDGSTVLMNATSTAGLNYLWMLDGINISNASTSSFIADAPGVYCLVASNTSGCKDTSNCLTVSNCLVGFEMLLASDVKLYPNPTSHVLNMEIPNYHSVVSIVVCDIQGRILSIQAKEQSHGSYLLPVSHLAKGLYQIRINTSRGQITRRFVKSE